MRNKLKIHSEVSIFVFCYLLIIILVIGLNFLEDFFHLSINNLDISLRNDFKKEPIMICFFAIVIAPLFEETIYRLPLVKNNHYFLSLFFLILFTLTLKFRFLQVISGVLFLLIILYQNVAIRYFKKVLIVVSVITFGLIHLNNYKMDLLSKISTLQILTLFCPQIILGVFVVYIRLKINFKTSILFHSLYNLTLIIIEITINN